MKSLLNTKVTIVGMGLIGGSLAKALKGKVARTVAVDTNRQTIEQSLAGGIADEATVSFREGVATADLVVLATPVRTISSMISELVDHRPDGCLLIDVGSTKNQIGSLMSVMPDSFEAIGGHPICGRESSGLGASSSDLFRDQTFVLCRNRRTTAAVERIALEVIEAIGARPLFMLPPTHDRLVAVTSHLPYLVAALLMRRAANVAANDELMWQVSATGFRDASRLAGSNSQMMLDILLTNRLALLQQLEEYQRELSGLMAMLEAHDVEALFRWLATVEAQHTMYREQDRTTR